MADQISHQLASKLFCALHRVIFRERGKGHLTMIH